MKRVSQIAFSIGLIGLAIIGIVHGDFCIISPPDPATKWKWFYILGSGLVVAGGILAIIKIFAFGGSLVCASAIFLFSYILKVGPIFAKSTFFEIINSADGWETLALIGGCLILASSFKRNDFLLKTGIATESAWFLWAGIGHFEYKTYVVALIPGYIPFPMFWVCFCGICLMLASVGLWIPKLRVLTATLAAIMLFLWCIMLHIPNYFTYPGDITRLMGIFESLSFAGIMGILASEFRTPLNN